MGNYAALAELACAQQPSQAPGTHPDILCPIQPALLPPSLIPGTSDASASTAPSPSPFPRRGFSVSAAANGYIYIFGGFTGTFQYMNDLSVYSTKENTITALQCYGDIPAPRMLHSSVIIGSILVVFGGTFESGVQDNSLYVLNLTSHEWTRIVTHGQAPISRSNHTMAAVGTTIFVFGGRISRTALADNNVWAFDIREMANQPTWKVIGHSAQELPLPRASAAWVPYQDHLIIFGGTAGTVDSQEALSDIWYFSINSGRWIRSESTIPTSVPPGGIALTVVEDVAYLFGGDYCSQGRYAGKFSAFNLSTQQWFMLEHLGPALYAMPTWAVMVAVDTKLLLFEKTYKGKNTSTGDYIHILNAENLKDPNLRHLRNLKESGKLWSDVRAPGASASGQVNGVPNSLGNYVTKELHESYEHNLNTLKKEAEKERMAMRELECEVRILRKLKAEVIEIRELKAELTELKELIYQVFLQVVHKVSTRNESILSLRDEDAQVMMDFLTRVLEDNNLLSMGERKRILRIIPKLAQLARVFPRKYELTSVECDIGQPVDWGGYGTVYKGTLNGQAVGIKTVRVYKTGVRKTALKANAKELSLAASMSHPNVLPFYGAYMTNEKMPRICLVSPWMENGNLIEYLDTFPETPPIPLASDVIAGLRYMHQELEIVHSDLKAANVLVSGTGRAMLADFGISTIVAHDGDTTTTQEAAGTPNWMAPELLLEEDTVAAGSHGSAGGGTSRPTTKSDMWAFGCVCFQLLTGRIPFEMYRGLYQMIRAFKRSHVTPLQPDTGEVFPGVEAHQGPLMDLAKRCWDRDPEQRLTAEEAHQALGNLSVNDARPSRDEELELYAAGKGARSTATIDYRHLLSVFQRISKHVTPLASKTVGDVT